VPPDPAMADRLRRARESAGYMRAVDAIQAFGWNKSTYYCHENASRGISRDQLIVYANAFHIARDWLASGQGPMRGGGPRRIRIEGHVGNLAIERENLQAEQIVEEIDLPLGIDPEEFVAYRVRGDSSYPVWRNRDVILIARNHGPPEDYLGKLCVVQVSGTGKRLIRVVERGTRAGVFLLLTHFGPAMIDVELLEAAPIVWTKHGG
jgi:phage repressor protein C with HTH and peptisase S24 domain